ncbi:MAG: hypothetical protein JWQ75_3249 [Pseudarthrobacter sp.]|nr:hypothetical protein [Pseudarthrobacter sp.]
MTLIKNSLTPASAPERSAEVAGTAERDSVVPGIAEFAACTCQRDEGRELAGNVVELSPGAGLAKKRWQPFPASEAGMATAEYAIATLAAVGFAGILVFVLRSDEVRGFLLTLIRTALALP